MRLGTQISKFGVVGAIGFVIDAGVLWVLVSLGVDAILARFVSFPIAVFATWWLNRHWTFSHADKAHPQRQLRLYLAVQIIGALSNLAVYTVVLGGADATPARAVFALAVGSFFAMFLNFAGSRLLIFRGVAEHPSDGKQD